MRQRDPRNVRDALLEAGHSDGEVEAMLAAAEARRELDRLAHCFDRASNLRFIDFAQRAQSQALVALRLIADIAPTSQAHTSWSSGGMELQAHPLDSWRSHAKSFNFET